MMRRGAAVESSLFRLFLTALGLICVAVSVGHLILGVNAIPGAIPVSTTNDSEDRFYAMLFLFFGVATLWGARSPAQRISALRALMLVFFVGGAGRVASIAAMGLPHPLFVVLGLLELAIPLLFWSVDRAPLSAWLPQVRASDPAIRPYPALASAVAVFGAGCGLIAVTYLAVGWPAVPGGSPLNATMDSELRFYASLFLGFGSALVWTSFDLARRRGVFLFLLAGFGAAGAARVISWIAVGAPSRLFVSQTVLELVLPVILWAWLLGNERARALAGSRDTVP